MRLVDKSRSLLKNVDKLSTELINMIFYCGNFTKIYIDCKLKKYSWLWCLFSMMGKVIHSLSTGVNRYM